MYKAGVGDVTIVESFAELDNEENIIDEAQDTMTILSTYIEQMAVSYTHLTLPTKA